MLALSKELYNDLTKTLLEAGHSQLASRLKAEVQPKMLTSGEAAEYLGVSPNTVKNWLEGGHFPGAQRTPGGHWRFHLKDVEAVIERMTVLREKNRQGDLTSSDDDQYPDPPLL